MGVGNYKMGVGNYRPPACAQNSRTFEWQVVPRKDVWALDEAIALLLGFVPHGSARKWAEKNLTYFEPAQKFIEMAELTRTAIGTKKLFDPDEPSHFLGDVPIIVEIEEAALLASSL